MKKHIIAGGFMLASLGAACAQGLYDIAPNDDATESLPITWSASVGVGYEDNVTPTVVSGPGHDESSATVSASVGANWVSLTPRTTWDVYARLGGIYYFDAPSSMSDDFYANARMGVNFAHSVNKRLRFASRNYIAYELEPDYSYGITLDRQLDPYTFWNTDNSVGYKWSERFATYTGFSYTGINYGSDSSQNDRDTWTVYNQFRYNVSPQTTWTLDYRYSDTTASGSAQDSTSHYVLAGIERRFSPTTVGVLKVGAQFRDSDAGGSNTNPFLEGALRSRLTEQLSVRAYARYSMEDYGTSFGTYSYNYNDAFRFGLTGNYMLSPQLSFQGGINYVMTSFQEASNANSDLDQDLWNLNVGFTYKINDALFLTGSYNFTDSSSSGGTNIARDSRDYTQNRANLGLRFEF